MRHWISGARLQRTEPWFLLFYGVVRQCSVDFAHGTKFSVVRRPKTQFIFKCPSCRERQQLPVPRSPSPMTTTPQSTTPPPLPHFLQKGAESSPESPPTPAARTAAWSRVGPANPWSMRLAVREWVRVQEVLTSSPASISPQIRRPSLFVPLFRLGSYSLSRRAFQCYTFTLPIFFFPSSH